MKRVIVLVIAVILVILSGTTTFADNDFIVKHSVINDSDEFCDINVFTPYFEGFNGSNEINRQIKNMVTDAIGNVRAMGIELKEFERKTTLDIDYDYSKYDELLSVQLITYIYSGGAHGSTQIDPITVNTLTGNIYTFKDLFKNEIEGISFVEKYILDTIMKDPEWYFENYEQTIKDKHGEYDFYFDGNSLVVYFGEYDIAPYASGIRYFKINVDGLKDILKEEVYNSVKKGQKKGSITFNGVDINSKYEVIQYKTWTSMVPLRDIAKSLGYEVGWNKENGAIIAGGFIKPGVDTYWKTGKEPEQMTAPLAIDGVTYVPLNYFTYVLEENVRIDYRDNDKLIVRVFGKDGFENNFDRLIKGFSFPLSGEAAAKMYAEAVKTRNGAVQYGLFSDEIRKNKFMELSDLAFVTGVSSPWVDNYEITKINDNTFKIEFTLKTSVPADLTIETVNITVAEKFGYWKIVSIE